MRHCLVAFSDDPENENTPIQIKLKDLQTQLPRLAALQVDCYSPPFSFVTCLNSAKPMISRGILTRPRFRENSELLHAGRRVKWDAAFVNILNMSVALAVVALPKGKTPAHAKILELTLSLQPGLPLAATIALAFATKQMSKENILVRVRGSCETMANLTMICTDKTRDPDTERDDRHCWHRRSPGQIRTKARRKSQMGGQ
jgi:hypothetical protein